MNPHSYHFQFGSKVTGFCIPDSGNQYKNPSLFANKSNNITPTKKEGIEYKMNTINDIPLSIKLSLLYAEYIPKGRLIKYAKNIFTLWTESELNAIGLYTVEENNTNLKDSYYYTNTSISYTFADNKVTSTYNSPTAKNLATLKTVKIKEVNSLAMYKLRETDWEVIKAKELDESVE